MYLWLMLSQTYRNFDIKGEGNYQGVQTAESTTQTRFINYGKQT